MAKCIHWLMVVVFLGSGMAWNPGAALGQSQGQSLFNDKCAMCHGRDGTGNGPAGMAFSPPPANFTNPNFWQGDVKQKISHTITNGHGPMPAFTEMSPSQIKAVIEYMEQQFKP
jgi:mono/diheme cytochrome c family protein